MPISLHDLLAKEFPPENHLVSAGLLDYNSIMVVGGPPKSYKSFIVTTMAIQLATQQPLFNAQVRGPHKSVTVFDVAKPCRVLILEQEVGEMDMQTRLRAMLGRFSPAAQEQCGENLYVHSCDHDMRLDTLKGMEHIGSIIKQVGPDVVIFDPLKEFHFTDENSAKDMGIVLHAIDRLRDQYRFASIISHHTKKRGQDDSNEGPDQLRGSSSLFAKGDSFMMVRSLGGRRHGMVSAEFTIRRGKPIPGFMLHMHEETMLAEFEKWNLGREAKLEAQLCQVFPARD